MSRLGGVVGRLRAFLGGAPSSGAESLEKVAHEKRAAVDHAADAAERIKRRMESPRIRLIVQSADDMRGIFEDRNGERRP